MLFLVLFTMVAVGIIAYAVWPAFRDAIKDSKRSAQDPDGGVSRPRVRESLEGTLVAQLAAGEITHRQYLQAMEDLAARDDERHPFAVPPNIGPDA